MCIKAKEKKVQGNCYIDCPSECLYYIHCVDIKKKQMQNSYFSTDIST